MAGNENTEKSYFRVYERFGIVFLPHYKTPDLYVAPGGGEVAGARLRQLGAVEERRLLCESPGRVGTRAVGK